MDAAFVGVVTTPALTPLDVTFGEVLDISSEAVTFAAPDPLSIVPNPFPEPDDAFCCPLFAVVGATGLFIC